MRGYKRQTQHFGIPVPGKEKLRSEVEMLKYQIIENQLLAASKGMKCAVFEEGQYTVQKQDNGKS